MKKILFCLLVILMITSGCQKTVTYDDALAAIKEQNYQDEVKVTAMREDDESWYISVDENGTTYTYTVSKSDAAIKDIAYEGERVEYERFVNGYLTYDEVQKIAYEAYGREKGEVANECLIEKFDDQIPQYSFAYADSLYTYEVLIDASSGAVIAMERKDDAKQVFRFDGQLSFDEAFKAAEQAVSAKTATEVTIFAISAEVPYYEVHFKSEDQNHTIRINALDGATMEGA